MDHPVSNLTLTDGCDMVRWYDMMVSDMGDMDRKERQERLLRVVKKKKKKPNNTLVLITFLFPMSSHVTGGDLL